MITIIVRSLIFNSIISYISFAIIIILVIRIVVATVFIIVTVDIAISSSSNIIIIIIIIDTNSVFHVVAFKYPSTFSRIPLPVLEFATLAAVNWDHPWPDRMNCSKAGVVDATADPAIWNSRVMKNIVLRSCEPSE